MKFQKAKVKETKTIRATNIVAIRDYLTAKVDSVKGQVRNEKHVGLSVCHTYTSSYGIEVTSIYVYKECESETMTNTPVCD